MTKVIRPFLQLAAIAVNFIPGIGQLASFAISTALLAGATLLGGRGTPRRAAAAATLQLGEQPRQAILGRAALGGSLIDAFNYGGKYGTDWEVLVIALADHRCDALEGFFVDDTYVTFAGDGNVAGFNSQLQVFWRDGQWGQTVPSILTTNGPGWTANDRGRGVAYVVVAYKADKSDAKNPVWPSGRPRFRWVVRGLRCYQARKDSTVGGSGAHRRDNPATWEWTENPIDIRYNWVRGIYAGDLVDQPGMLLIGRGLSAIEAPPANVFARANLCDELVGGQPRYRVGGVVAANEPFIDVESDFAAAVAGTISQPQGAVEVDPGQAKAPVAHFTDDDVLIGSTVRWNEGKLGQQDEGWVNTVAPRFVDPAQRWTVRSAPVQRDLADIIADRGPREQQPQLDFVSNGPQAQRIGQIIRRLGRLWGRGSVTLPPRFAFIEEGDWVTWQSNRRFGGATLTFRVEAWGSDQAWHHQLTLRQISASVFSDTAPLDDGSIAYDQPEPPVVAAPGVGAWNAAAVLLGGGSVRIPNLRIVGATDDPAASFVVFEYIQQVAAPTLASIWTFAASSRPEVTLLDIPVPEGGTFWVAVSYVVDGIQGDRRVLGPISTSGLSFSDGSPVAPVAPANANRLPFTRLEGGRGWAAGGAPGGTGQPFLIVFNGRYFICAEPVFTLADQNHFLFNNGRLPVIPGERLSVSTRIQAFGLPGGFDPNFWQIYFEYWDSPIGGTSVGSTLIAQGVGSISENVLHSAFTTVPVGAQAANLVLRYESDGAGPVRLAFLEPMVASAAAGQTVHPPYSPGPNAVDGATRNTGALNADGLDAVDAGGPLLVGQLPPSKADPGLINTNVPLGANAVVNSDFTRGKFGWRWGGGGFESQWGVNLPGTPNWFGQRNVMWANFPGVFASGLSRDLSPDALWEGGTLANAPLFALAVTDADRLFASVLAAPHRCTFQLWILIFDGAGTLIQAEQATGGLQGGAANGDPANFARITRFTDVTTGGRWAIPMMRMLGTGETDPYIFFTEPMLSKVAAGQTVAPPYAPGRADPNADVTAQEQISFSEPAPFQIQADSAGVTTTDLGSQTRSITLRRGGVAQTSGVTVGTPTASPSPAIAVASATVSGGVVTVTLSAANASGSVTIPVIFGGVTYPVTIPVNRTIAAPVAGGSGSQPFTDQTWSNINSTTYAAVTDAGSTVLSSSGGQLQFSYSAQYEGGIAQCKAQYSADGMTWFDVSGSEVTGSPPITVPGEEAPGDISRSPVTQTGLAGSTLYHVRLVARRTAGSTTLSWLAPTFTARQP